MHNDDLLKTLNSKALEKNNSDGSAYRTLLFSDELLLAEMYSCSHRQIQLLAMENDIVPQRYTRNQKTLTIADQARLLGAHAAVAGLGGLGGAVVELLARVGVGKLTLIDGDRFEDSNLNRQLLSSVSDLGKSKVEVAARRVKDVNPAVETRSRGVFLDSGNCLELIGDADIAIDCLDTIPVRFELQQGCADASIAMISAAVGGVSGQAMVVYPGEPGLKQVYNVSEDGPHRGVEVVSGTMAFTAAAMAAVQCALAVSLLLGKEPGLQRRLLLADFDDYSMLQMAFDPGG